MTLQVTFPSAGHYNQDAGASYNGRQENKETVVFRNLLNLELEKLGIKCISDQDNENNHQYQNRIKPGLGSVVLDIHFNAGKPVVSGTECFVGKNASKDSLSMANEITQMASVVMGIPNRGVRRENESQHSKIGILNLGSGIAVLWEICFISNLSDMRSFDRNKEVLAEKLAKILKKYDDKF